MNNPFLRRALQLEDSFFNFKTASPQIAVIPQNFEHLSFRQLIAQHTGEQLPSGRSLYRKIKWAHEHYGDKVPDADFAENSLTKRQAWNKWKKLIKLILLEELVNKDQDSQDITIIAVPEGTVTINELGLAVAPQPNIAIDDQALSTTDDTVIKIDEPTVNPAPPIAPQPEPTVNPAPPIAPQPEPTVNPAPPIAPQPEPTVNPAPPVAPQPEPTVNPASPVAPQPEPTVNPAPPIAEAKGAFGLVVGDLDPITASFFEIIDCGPFLPLYDIDFSQQSLAAAKDSELELEQSVSLFSASSPLYFSDLLSDEQSLSNIFNDKTLDSAIEGSSSESQSYAAIIATPNNAEPLVVEQLYIDL